MQFRFGFGYNTPFHIRFRPQLYGRLLKLAETEVSQLMEDLQHWMGLHRLHRETNLGIKPQCYRDGLWDTTMTLYMLNRVMGDVRRGGGDSSVGQNLPERWAAGDRHQNYACPAALTASPPSPSFPHSPPALSVAGPVVPCDTGGITVE